MFKNINYTKKIDGEKNWAIEETSFDINTQGKFETIFSLGNGYLGLRAVTEEEYENRHYGLFIGGTFNTPKGDEVPELPNGADILNMEFIIDSEKFKLNDGKVENYTRYLDLKNGILIRKFIWTSFKTNATIEFSFKTFTSFDNIHLIGQEVKVKSLNKDVEITFVGGINGQTTNSGTQHFTDYDTQFKNLKIQQYVFKTDQSNIDFYYNRSFNFYINNKLQENIQNSVQSVYGYDRRKVYQEFDLKLQKEDELKIESFSTIETSRDFDWDSKNDKNESLIKQSKVIETFLEEGFENLYKKHLIKYKDIFDKQGIEIESTNDLDVLFTRMAIYQIYKITPQFDNRLNIDAKGWTGEEYKGHTFWDSEIYILPYYIYTNPRKARELLEHRYFVKESAHMKAKQNNLKGAMWPWETSWVKDGETCPTWGEVDFKTGKRMKVWAAFNELHISADIMWAIDLYYQQTNDQDFMNNYGYEMLFDTAIFWANKGFKNRNGIYELLNITGPNEYKEDIDNNIFTNYMVKFSMEKMINYYIQLEKNNRELFNKITNKIELNKNEFDLIVDFTNNLYLPQKNKDGIYPENDTFLSLKNIPNLEFYKKNRGSIWKEYTANEINDYQILKQADLVALFYTEKEKFDYKDIINNWKYYESRTLHTSSLSLSMHCVTACLIKEKELAYEFFKKSAQVDYGENMSSSNNGIHSASIGGILKCVIEGFGGIRKNKNLEINPLLPKEISIIKYNFSYLNNEFKAEIDKNKIKIIRLSGTDEIDIYINGKKETIKNHDAWIESWYKND